MIRIKVYTKFGWKYGRISIKRKHFSFIHFHHIWQHAQTIFMASDDSMLSSVL